MTIQYVSDTGTVDIALGTATIVSDFTGTMPSVGHTVCAGGAFWVGSSQTITVTDDHSNTYSVVQLKEQSGDTTFPAIDAFACIWSAPVDTTGASFAVTFTAGTTTYGSAGAYCFSGVDTASPFDVGAGNTQSGASLSSIATGTTGTTAQDDSLALIANSASLFGGNITSQTATNYTISIAKNDNTSSAHQGCFGYRILTATGTQSATITFGASSGSSYQGQACIAVLKGSASAAAAPPIPIIQSVVMR